MTMPQQKKVEVEMMSPEQRLADTLRTALDTLGYQTVLEAIKEACAYYATAPDSTDGWPTTPDGPPEVWAQRARALERAMWEDDL
jgi:hypothetical protein